jgi:membrane protease YdiL (CAAX protease family)
MKTTKYVATQSNELQPTTLRQLSLLLAVPTALNALACLVLIPWSERALGVPIEAAYFLSVGICALVPMFFGALLLTRREVGSDWRALLRRLGLKALSATDVAWAVAGFIVLCGASWLIADRALPLLGMDGRPYFFHDMPLQAGNRWLLLAWLPFFFFNIMGEELYWRGYVLPRQHAQMGGLSWLAHGLMWATWHLPMGIDLVLAALPIFFILPAIVQLRRNTTIAIVIHTVFGAFGFLVLAFGIVH